MVMTCLPLLLLELFISAVMHRYFIHSKFIKLSKPHKSLTKPQANVYAESGQTLTIRLYDKDDAKDDENLGMYV